MVAAAAQIVHETEFVVVGSQSILGSFPQAPAALLRSQEADLYPRRARFDQRPEVADADPFRQLGSARRVGEFAQRRGEVDHHRPVFAPGVFVEDPDQRPVAFLCRSGNRSIGAAEAATEAGFGPAYNILDGFEGNLDERGHRGATGWKAVGLPWKQS